MSSLISPGYAELNRRLHETDPSYGTSAAEWAPTIANICRENGSTVILDYGCGKGTLKTSLARIAPQLTVLEYDPAICGKEVLPATRPHLVVGLDIMEHIEPDYLNVVLKTIHGTGADAVFLSISTAPATKTLPDGRNAHILIRSPDWWRDTLSLFFAPIFVRVNGIHLVYAGKPLSTPSNLIKA